MGLTTLLTTPFRALYIGLSGKKLYPHVEAIHSFEVDPSGFPGIFFSIFPQFLTYSLEFQLHLHYPLKLSVDILKRGLHFFFGKA